MEIAIEHPPKLMNRDFFLLWQGQVVSQMGNQVYSVAMIFWLAHATNSAAALGLLMMLSTLPAAVLGPLGGTLADRHSRRSIIILSDIFCGALVLALASLLLFAPQETRLIIPGMFVVALLLGVAGIFFRPAIAAAIPDMVPPDKIVAANSLNQVSLQLTQFIGQGLGGVLFRLLGAPVLFFANGISYFFAAFSESFLEIPQTMPEKSRSRKELLQNIKRETLEGVRFVWTDPGMRNLFLAMGFLNFFIVPIGLLMPFYTENVLKAKSDWYGFLVAGLAAGALVGSILAGSLKLTGRARSKCVVAFLFLLSTSLGLLGLSTVPLLSLLLVVVVGIMSGFINISVVSVLQMKTATHIRGRVFGLLNTMSTGLVPISMGLAGVVTELVHKRIPLIYLACGGMTALLSVFVSSKRNFRDFLAYEQSAPTTGVRAQYLPKEEISVS